jgi:hypothetical protein
MTVIPKTSRHFSSSQTGLMLLTVPRPHLYPCMPESYRIPLTTYETTYSAHHMHARGRRTISTRAQSPGCSRVRIQCHGSVSKLKRASVSSFLRKTNQNRSPFQVRGGFYLEQCRSSTAASLGVSCLELCSRTDALNYTRVESRSRV